MISNKLRSALTLFLAFAISGCCAGPSVSRVKEGAEPETDSDKSEARTADEKQAPCEIAEVVKVDIVEVGRALEAGDIEKASSLFSGDENSPEALLLLARIAAAKGDYEEAVRRYHSLTDKQPGFETTRIVELAGVLAQAGRPEEAATTTKTLLDSAGDLTGVERLNLMEKRASWLAESGHTDEALKTLEEATKLAGCDLTADRLNLEMGRVYIAAGDLPKAKPILSRLALKANRASIMDNALRELEKAGTTPYWSAEQRLDRARTLMSLRSWDAALSTLKPMLGNRGQDAIGREARFLSAQILFNRRRHYEEALESLYPIAKEGGTHAEEAEFLIARALSRLDRDEEALDKYRVFAKKTKKPAKAAEARFLAARLEFYLGKHRSALRSFERLVGDGKRDNAKSRLEGEQKREAHFLAGMSALLAKMSARAEPHFIAASQGANNSEVLARNHYWTAVARCDRNKKAGLSALGEICSQDSTCWYAHLAARRIEDLKGDPGPCRSVDLEPALDTVEIKPLDKLSPLAAFYARAGLFREAASELKRAEESGVNKASTRDWVANYVALDAPRFSIQRASAGLKWPPKREERWLARAAYPSPYENLVEEVEKQHGLPGELIFAVARKESLFKPDAVSGAGAMGMMQMMPHTFEKNRKRAGLPPLEQGEIPGPEQSIRAAGFEFADLMERFGDSIPLILMAYNAGPGAVSRWLERSGGLPIDVFVEKAGFAQTRNYVRRVFKNLVRYRMLAGKPAPELPRKAEIVKRVAAGEPGEFEESDAGEDTD
jgi:soluble lytic murein transglycosylase